MCPFCATTAALTAASAATATTAISTLGFDLIRQIVAGARSLTGTVPAPRVESDEEE
jgi:hypothetical protein